MAGIDLQADFRGAHGGGGVGISGAGIVFRERDGIWFGVKFNPICASALANSICCG